MTSVQERARENIEKARRELHRRQREERKRKAEIRLIRDGDFALYRKVVFRDIYHKPLRETWWDELLAKLIYNFIIGDEKRIILNMPTRYGKTEWAVRLAISYLLGIDPTNKAQYITYGDFLSKKTSVEIKKIMEHPKYLEIFPDARIDKKQNEKTMWEMEKWGSYLASSVGGGLTGAGSTHTVADDLIKALDRYSSAKKQEAIEFFKGSVMTRMEDEAQIDEIDEERDTEEGNVMLVMQRLAEDDPAGVLMKEQGVKKRIGKVVGAPSDEREDGSWTVLVLPALNDHDIEYRYEDFYYYRKANEPLDPRKHTYKQLIKKRRDLGEVEFQAQFNQDVEESESGFFCKEVTWISDFDLPPMSQYISVDTAESKKETADDRAIVVEGWAVNEHEEEIQILLDGWHGKGDVYDVCEQIIRMMLKFPDADVFIEGAGGGLTLGVVLEKEVMKANARLRAEGKTPLTNAINVYAPSTQITKQSKISMMRAPFENHTFKIYKGCDRAFFEQFNKERLRFDPHKKQQKDNCIDAAASPFLFAVPKRIEDGERVATKRVHKAKRNKTWRL